MEKSKPAPTAKKADAAKPKAATKPAAKDTEKKAETKTAGDANASEKAQAEEAGEHEHGDAKAEMKADKKPKKAVGANPLANLIKGIFGPKQPAPAATRTRVSGQPAKDKDGTARDHIDARVPHDPQMAGFLRRAEGEIENKQWKDALEILQVLLDRPEDAVIRQPNGEWSSLRDEANRMLGGLPDEFLQQYRLQFGVVARQLYEDAVADNDVPKLLEVATRYFQTEAGYAAADRLGVVSMDRGKFPAAARWFKRLEEADAPVTKNPPWRLKAAFAFKQAGLTDDARKLLSSVRRPVVGGETVDAASWLDNAEASARVASTLRSDWRMLMGSPARDARIEGGAPLLLPRWSYPSTHNQQLIEQIDELTEDLTDSGKAAIPAFVPIVVDGKAIFRTLRGVQVVDASTGTPLWETREGASPERLLTGKPPEQAHTHQQVFVVNGMLQTGYSGGNADYHKLTSLLYRNGVWGTISSDGERLFVLEDHAVLSDRNPGYQSWGWNQEASDAYRRDWNSNKLVAYSLKTGRPMWEVGGEQRNEPFDLRLAGNYFFGAPTPAGEELLVMGEQNKDVRLFALDPGTGAVKWSRLLAHTDAKIEDDYGRRWWIAQPSVKGGVVVCPTTVGWLVALDRSTREILWAHRYSKPGGSQPHFNSNNGQFMVQQSSLNTQWTPSAPVIAGDRVLYAHPFASSNNNPALVCLNLLDGKKLWQKPKTDALYFAGVFDDRALIVSPKSVAALSLENGTTDWTRTLTSSDSSAGARPAGVGVATAEHYHLPLASGRVWSLKLSDGSVVSKAKLPDDQPQLGNLMMYKGAVLSLSARGMAAFEQREALLAEIAARKQNNPDDAWALVREAEMQSLSDEHAKALKMLRRIDPVEVDPGEKSRYRRDMVETLAAVIRSDFESHDAEMKQLAEFVATDDERREHRQLLAQQYEARGRYSQAFGLYQELTARDDEFVPLDHKSGVEVRLHSWIAGRMRDLWERLPAGERARLDDRVASEAIRVTTAGTAERSRFVALFGFHPASLTVKWKTAEELAEAGKFGQAQQTLLRLADHSDDYVSATALRRLAELCERFDLKQDAAWYWQALARRAPDVHVDVDATASTVVATLKRDGRVAELQPVKSVDWGDFDLKSERTGNNNYYGSRQEPVLGPFRLPWLQNHRFDYDYQNQRFTVLDAHTDRVHWTTPLRTDGRSSSMPAVEAVGHNLLVLNRGALQLLSPVEKRIIWSRSLVDGGANGGANGNANEFNRNTQFRQPQVLAAGNSMVGQHSLKARRQYSGGLAVVNSDYICVQGRRRIHVYDANTGDLRWTSGRLPNSASVVGTSEAVFVNEDGNRATVYRALDGKKLDVAEASSIANNAIHVVGNDVVLVEKGAGGLLGLTTGNLVVKRFNPLTGQERWLRKYPNSARMSVPADGMLVVLEADGGLKTLDLESGESQPFDAVENFTTQSRNFIAVVDQDRLYLVVNQNNRNGYAYYYNNLPSMRMNGEIIAFDRESRSMIWKQTVKNQNLVLCDFVASPVLIAAGAQYKRIGNTGFSELSIVGIDKATGRRLVEITSPGQSSFTGMELDLARRSIELSSYNVRFTFYAEDKKTAAVDAVEQKPEKNEPPPQPAAAPVPDVD